MELRLRCDMFYETYNLPHRQQKALDANCSYWHKLALRSVILPKYKKQLRYISTCSMLKHILVQKPVCYHSALHLNCNIS